MTKSICLGSFTYSLGLCNEQNINKIHRRPTFIPTRPDGISHPDVQVAALIFVLSQVATKFSETEVAILIAVCVPKEFLKLGTSDGAPFRVDLSYKGQKVMLITGFDDNTLPFDLDLKLHQIPPNRQT